MDESDQFENLLDQLGQMMNLLQEFAGKSVDEGKITPEVIQRFITLKKNIQKFGKLGEKYQELTQEQLQLFEKNFGSMPPTPPNPRSKRLVDKAAKLKEQAERLKELLPSKTSEEDEETEDSEEAETSPPPPSKKMDDETFRKRRRRKFKNFGDK